MSIVLFEEIMSTEDGEDNILIKDDEIADTFKNENALNVSDSSPVRYGDIYNSTQDSPLQFLYMLKDNFDFSQFVTLTLDKYSFNRKDDYVLIITMDGLGSVNVNGYDYALSQGAWVLIKPNTSYTLQNISEINPLRLMIVYVRDTQKKIYNTQTTQKGRFTVTSKPPATRKGRFTVRPVVT